MLYNIEKKKIKEFSDCFNCKHYDTIKKQCSGINKACFEYDPKTRTIIDGVTKMPIKL